jgi:hypothetical protein
MEKMKILAADLREGDEMSWDRPERFFWLKVRDVVQTSGLIISDLELAFSDIADLGEFGFASAEIDVHAIDVGRQTIVLQQTNNQYDPLIIRR